MNTIRWHWCSSLPHLEPSHWLNRNQQIIKVYKLNSQILLNKCLIVLKKKQLFQTSNLSASWLNFLPVKCVKKVWMISHQYLQSGHSVEHFKGYLNARMRHPSSYAFSIKTTNFGSPLSELKFHNYWNQILWHHITP